MDQFVIDVFSLMLMHIRKYKQQPFIDNGKKLIADQKPFILYSSRAFTIVFISFRTQCRFNTRFTISYFLYNLYEIFLPALCYNILLQKTQRWVIKSYLLTANDLLHANSGDFLCNHWNHYRLKQYHCFSNNNF